MTLATLINMSKLPSYMQNGIWLPLTAAFISICCFSYFYISRYRKKYERDFISFMVSVFALILVFILTALAPVDTYIVSEMKNSSGEFKDWASSIEYREKIEQRVMIGYIVLYSFICFTVYCVLPFAYFLYDSRDDESESRSSSICSALMSTLVVLVIPITIVIISLFVDIRGSDDHPVNSTFSFTDKMSSFTSDGGSKIISNLVCVLGAIGMLNLIIYTGFGLSSWPIGLIRGFQDVKQDFEEVSRRQVNNTAAINSLRSKRAYLGKLNEDDERLLIQLETRERDDQLKETIMRNHLSSWSYKLRSFIRPFEIIFGLFFLCVSTLIITSLFINNIDSLLHGSSKDGFLVKKKTIFNPIDWLLIQSNRIYPLDYIIYMAISWILIFSTLSGIRNLGISLFFYKLGKFKPRATTPQGLILASFILMMSMMAINLLMFSIAPIYSSYGHQMYLDENGKEMQCDLTSSYHQCTITRSSYIIENYFYHIPYVGMGFFFSTWLVALFFVLAFVYSICRKSRKNTIDEFDNTGFEEESS